MGKKASATAKAKKPSAASEASDNRIMYVAPFTEPGWGQFRSPDYPGFWTAVRVNSFYGSIVAQLGAKPPAPGGQAIGQQFAGFQYVFTPTVAGEHYFWMWASTEVVTHRPRGGLVNTFGRLALFQAGRLIKEKLVEVPPSPPGPNPPIITITPDFTVSLRANIPHVLRMGFDVRISYSGSQTTYGEVIGWMWRLDHKPPTGALISQSGGQAQAGLKEGERIDDLIKSDKELITKEVSEEEAAREGITLFERASRKRR